MKAKGSKCGREGNAERPRGTGKAQPNEERWMGRAIPGRGADGEVSEVGQVVAC